MGDTVIIGKYNFQLNRQLLTMERMTGNSLIVKTNC